MGFGEVPVPLSACMQFTCSMLIMESSGSPLFSVTVFSYGLSRLYLLFNLLKLLPRLARLLPPVCLHLGFISTIHRSIYDAHISAGIGSYILSYKEKTKNSVKSETLLLRHTSTLLLYHDRRF